MSCGRVRLSTEGLGEGMVRLRMVEYGGGIAGFGAVLVKSGPVWHSNSKARLSEVTPKPGVEKYS